MRTRYNRFVSLEPSIPVRGHWAFARGEPDACRCRVSGNLGVESGRPFDENVPRYPDVFIAKSLPHTPGGDGLGLGDTASNAPVRALERPGCGNPTQVCAVEGLIVLCVRKELCLDRGWL